jgi:hypothetical protein
LPTRQPAILKQHLQHFPLQITGKAIRLHEIAIIDTLCRKYECMLLLQRWGRRYLRRLQLYHSVRRYHAVLLQCGIRVFLAKRRVFHRKRARAVVVLQCMVGDPFLWQCSLHLSCRLYIYIYIY